MSRLNIDLFDAKVVGPDAESDFGGRVMPGGYSEVDRATGVCSTGGICSSDVAEETALAQSDAADMGAGMQVGGRRTRRYRRRRNHRGGRRSSSQKRRSQKRMSGRFSLKQHRRH